MYQSTIGGIYQPCQTPAYPLTTGLFSLLGRSQICFWSPLHPRLGCCKRYPVRFLMRMKKSDAIDKPDPRAPHIILRTLPALSFSTPTHSVHVQLAFRPPARYSPYL